MRNISLDDISRIYNRLEDDLSKRIFIDRLAYSVGEGQEKATKKLILDNQYVEDLFYRLYAEKHIVVFGFGKIAKRILKLFPKLKIRCVIDNAEKTNSDCAFDIYDAETYLKTMKTSEDLLLITPINGNEEMEEQLLKNGIEKSQIVNLGGAFKKAQERQYFDLPEMEWMDEEFFVDCGSFDGNTSVILGNMIKDKLKKIVAFEPMADNIELCESNIKQIGVDYKIINKGVWEKTTSIYFRMAEHGMLVMSENDEKDSTRLEVTSLDETIGDAKVTFIKMDIEGSELNALKGAKKIIQEQKPKLAICIYHLVDDFYRIPEYILSLNSDYRLFIRHYGTNSSETVLYAI